MRRKVVSKCPRSPIPENTHFPSIPLCHDRNAAAATPHNTTPATDWKTRRVQIWTGLWAAQWERLVTSQRDGPLIRDVTRDREKLTEGRDPAHGKQNQNNETRLLSLAANTATHVPGRWARCMLLSGAFVSSHPGTMKASGASS